MAMFSKAICTWVAASGLVLVSGVAAAQEAGKVRVENQTGRIVRLTSERWLDVAGNPVERNVTWLIGPGEQLNLAVDGQALVAREFHFTVRSGKEVKAGASRYQAGDYLRIELRREDLPPAPAVAVAERGADARPLLPRPPAALPQDPVLRQHELARRQIERQLGGRDDDWFVLGLAETSVSRKGPNPVAGIFGVLFAPLTLGASLQMLEDGGVQVSTYTSIQVVHGKEAASQRVLDHLLQAQTRGGRAPAWRLLGRHADPVAADRLRQQYDRIYNPHQAQMEQRFEQARARIGDKR